MNLTLDDTFQVLKALADLLAFKYRLILLYQILYVEPGITIPDITVSLTPHICGDAVQLYQAKRDQSPLYVKEFTFPFQVS